MRPFNFLIMKKDLEFLVCTKLNKLKFSDLEVNGQFIGKETMISYINSPCMPGWQYDFETNLVTVDKGNFHCSFDFNFLNLYNICKRFEKYKPAPIVIKIETKPIVKIQIQTQIAETPARIQTPEIIIIKNWYAPKRKKVYAW